MHRISTLALAVATVGITTAALVGCGTTGSTTVPTSGSTVTVDAPAPAPDEPTFADNVLTTTDVVVRITDVRTIQVGEEGNEYGKAPVIAFWYDTTNVSGEEIDPGMAWILHFGAYQDNDPNAENELEVGALPDKAFLNSQLDKIKKGGTVSNAISYTLSDTTTPVQLVASTNFGRDEIGSMTFELK